MSVDDSIQPAPDDRLSPEPLPTPRRRWSSEDDDDFSPERVRPSDRLPTVPSGPPHPGFWWSVLWCLGMLMVSQVVVPMVVIIMLLVVRSVQAGSLDKGMEWLKDLQSSPEMVAVLVVAHVTIIAVSLLALRFVVGRDWPRQVALRLPDPVHVVLAFVGLPAFWITAMGVYMAAAAFMPNLADFVNYVVTVVLLMAAVGLTWLIVRSTTGIDYVRELARAPVAAQLGLGIPYSVAVWCLGVVIFMGVAQPWLRIEMLGDKRMMEEFVEQVRKLPPLLGVAVIAGMPMISEELWCRAFLGRGLVGRHGWVMGVVWTSVFFGAIHVHPHQGTMAIIAGILLHYTYITSRSLLIPVLIHFLNNALAVVAPLAGDAVGKRLEIVDTNPEKLPWQLFAAAGLLLAAVLWAFWTSRARLVPADGSDDVAWQPPYPSVALPPPGSGTVVKSGWPGILPTVAVVLGVAALIGALAMIDVEAAAAAGIGE